MVRLAWRTAGAVTRLGLRFAQSGVRLGIERLFPRARYDVRSETIEGDDPLREWRVWSSRLEEGPANQTERLSWSQKKTQ
jgi:hypothetical protein